MKTISKKISSNVLALIALPFLSLCSKNSTTNLKQSINTTLKSGSDEPITNLEPRLYYSKNNEFNYPKFSNIIINVDDKEKRNSQAPNFKEIYEAKFPSYISISPDVEFLSNGWPTLSSCNKMTYLQLFLNWDVATYFDPEGDPAKDLFNINSLFTFTTNTPDWDLSPHYDEFLKRDLNFYLDDPYADDTVKCLNNPFFYQLVSSNSSVLSQIKSINLSNNKLWNIPLLNFLDLPYDEVLKINNQDPKRFDSLFLTSSSISVSLKSESKVVKFIKCNKLKNLNLISNHITALPMVNIYKSDSDITKHDLTYQASSDFKISLDDNYIGVDPTWTIGDHPLHAISFDVSYENAKTLMLSKKKIGESDRIFQTSCLMTNEEYVANYLSDYSKQNKIDISSLSNTEIEQIILTYINKNHLSSDYIYTGSWLSEMLVSQIEYGKYMYAYCNTNRSKGKVDISIRLISPQTCSYNEDKTDFNITINNDEFHQFAFLSYKFANGRNVTLNVVIISIVCLLLVIGWIAFYYSWFKKYKIKKRKNKDLENINNTK